MRIFVTGATGFVGSAVVKELIGAGHQVLGMTRSDAGAEALTAAGAEVHHGTLEDLDSLRRGAESADGVIHTAFIHDFSKYQESSERDRQAIEALGDVLAGSDRPLLVTSGIAIVAPGRLVTENDPMPAGSLRVSEAAAESVAARGVRIGIIRLPPSVHDRGDKGFVPTLIGIAREKGASAYIGEGMNRWPAVHRLDAAHLYRLALENGTAGARYHGVGDEGIPTREIAETIARHLNVPLVPKSPEEAGEHFGWIARFFAIDCPASGAQTKETLDWNPTHSGLIADLEEGHYF